MELKIKTPELQSMVSKVGNCVSNNKLIPLTSLMSISVSNHTLTLATTNATNYFYVSSSEKVDCEDFEVSVIADLFIKLVQKTTSETVTMTVSGNTLKVKGNGTYTLELPLDENGSVIKFPRKYDMFVAPVGDIKASVMRNISAYNKASLAINMEFPALTNYYCGKNAITSDRKKICISGFSVFETPVLITPALMDLICCLESENISVGVSNENSAMLFSTNTDIIYAPIAEGIDTFPVAPIEQLANQDFPSSCKLSRTTLLNVLDRLSLFVSKYDKNAIYLTFTNEGLMVSSKKSSGEEVIPYVASENFKEYTCCINIEMLRSQLATQAGETLDLYYGSKVAIKLVDANVTQLVALFEDDRVEA